MSNITSIGDLISRARAAQQLSQLELAKQAKVGRVYIAQLEGGRRKDPSSSVLRKLCRALGPEFHLAVSAWLVADSETDRRRQKKIAKSSV